MTEQELLKLKKRVETAKLTVSQLQGQQTGILKQLKKDWDCDDIESAEKKLKLIDKKINQLETQFEKGIEELEQKLEENG